LKGLDRPYGKTVAAVLATLLWLTPAALGAEELDQAEAESRLDQVLEQIGQLKQQLENSRSEHRKEQDQLKALDLDIQQANLSLRDLQAQRERHLAELDQLEEQRADYVARLEERTGQLAEQVRMAYRTGRQSRLKLVLNQDNPAKLGRMLAYYDYLNRAQSRAISGLHESLATLQAMQQSIDAELERLAAVTEEKTAVMDRLTTQREDRRALLAQLDQNIESTQGRLQELERNRHDLEELIERLSDVLADIPADLGSHEAFSRQKGHLPMPVHGPVLQAFGRTRRAGLSWQGWLIGGDPGTEVQAVAYGRVAFADWLRGYGLLIIIDHGDGYMSLYGQNESLLREAGAWVRPGEVISIVGSNPGNTQGLYFELRKNGKALDPAPWMNR
jgi:septal ring factor EnvC (AmiA/AmiB activator)